MARIIGIDLGTSNSACAVTEAGKPVIIPSAEGTTLGGKAFPSYVAFTKDGQKLVGEPARRQAVANPEGTIMAAKRKMGTDHIYRLIGKEYTPQQISAFILQKIKQDTEAYLGEKISKAVITVPAYFNDNQRQATKDAGTIAGLEVERLVNEPTAACLAYGLDKAGKELKILVFDFGGGTLDVTIMEMWKEGGFKVMATSGDTQLGGTDMDNALIDYIAAEFKKDTGIDLRNDKMAMQRLREAAEKAKVELSSTLTTDINLPFITADVTGPKHLTMSINRAKIEELVTPIIERCRGPLEKALKDTKDAFAKESVTFGDKDVDKIIMVGGPTRMPIVQKFVEDYIGKKVEHGVDPMECVAMGAAIQGAIITGEVKDVLLLDVTPLSLGLETLGGVFTRLIERNTTIPTKRSQIFSTAADGQTAVTIHVLQGERPMTVDNVSLGHFDLVGIPTAPRGIPQIEVSFDIDENGILHVKAKDLGTNKEQSMRITAPTKLSKEEIDKMMKNAERFAEEDKKKKEEVELRNETDTLVYSTEHSLKEYGEKISQTDRASIESALNETKEVLKGKDIERIKKAKENLQNASYKLAEVIYREAAAKQQAGKGAENEAGKREEGVGAEEPKAKEEEKPKREDVVEGEYKEEK